MARPTSQKPQVLIYVLRRDVRLSDNPIFHRASFFASAADTRSGLPKSRDREDSLISGNNSTHFTHLLPVYVFPANQVEVSGFISDKSERCPHPEARSQVAGVWRTGPHRAKFMAEGAWNLKENLERLGCGSGLEIRVGKIPDVVEQMLDWYADGNDGGSRAEVAGIWMTAEVGTEEHEDDRRVKDIAERRGVDFKVWKDEKYYIDECVLPLLLNTPTKPPLRYKLTIS